MQIMRADGAPSALFHFTPRSYLLETLRSATRNGDWIEQEFHLIPARIKETDK
jgi:hypothetical protein